MKDYASMLLGPELTTPVEGTGLKDYASQILGDAATPAAKKPFQPPAPNALERFGRGFADYTQGVEQIARMVTGNDPKGFNAEKTAELELYERGRGPDAGSFDPMRVLGNAAVTAPLMAIPGATSPSILARAGSGAVGGAVGSALQFVPDGGSRTMNTMLGAGLGGVVGAVAPPLLDKAIVRPLRFLWEKAVGRNISDAATQAVMESVARVNGLDDTAAGAGRLVRPEDLQKSPLFASLAAEVDDALRQGTQFTPEQLDRLVQMRAVGANPMKANITRTPEDWATMENMRGMAKIAAPINNRIVENSRALVEYTEGLRSGTGARAASPYEAGRSVLEAVETKSKEMQDAVGALYEGIRKSVGDKVGLQPQRMLSVLDDISDDAAADPLVSSVNRRMTRLGLIDKEGQPTGKALDVRTAEELRKWIGNLSDKGEPAIKRLKAMVVDALDDDVIETAGDDAFKAARNAARQRFAEFEQGVLGKAAKGDLAPDDFVKRHVIGAKVDDLKAMKKTLTVGTPEQVARGSQAWNDARGWVITDIMMKATGATSPEDVVGKQFSGQRFKKALDGLGLEKMAILFTPDEMNRLRTLQKASEYLTTQVPGSAPNYSRTGAAITERLAQLFPKIPLLASVFGGPTGAAAGMAATGAAKAVGASQSAKALSQQLGGLPTVAARQVRPNRFLGSVPAAAAGVATQPRDGQ